ARDGPRLSRGEVELAPGRRECLLDADAGIDAQLDGRAHLPLAVECRDDGAQLVVVVGALPRSLLRRRPDADGGRGLDEVLLDAPTEHAAECFEGAIGRVRRSRGDLVEKADDVAALYLVGPHRPQAGEPLVFQQQRPSVERGRADLVLDAVEEAIDESADVAGVALLALPRARTHAFAGLMQSIA